MAYRSKGWVRVSSEAHSQEVVGGFCSASRIARISAFTFFPSDDGTTRLVHSAAASWLSVSHFFTNICAHLLWNLSLIFVNFL